MSDDKACSVYVMRNAAGRVKIGVSRNIPRRLEALSRAADRPLVWHATEPLQDAEAIERTAHTLLLASRHEGEWFNVSIDEAIAAVRDACERVQGGDFSLARTLPRSPNWRPARKATMSIRIEPDERAALEAAAREDDRTMSQLARKIIMEWLAKHGPKVIDRAA